MDECSQKEADTRVVVHVQHNLECGYREIVVQTVDTDIAYACLPCVLWL